MSAVDEVKTRINIVDLVSRYTPLKRAGSIYKGLCPFHSERTPSFIVFPHTNTWRCFGACGTGGDAISFLMRKENLEFREALQTLAQEVGVSLADEERDPNQNQRSALYEINTSATRYFQEVLVHHPGAQAARDYLRRRGLDQNTIERFQIGYALESWNALRDYLTAHGFSIDVQLSAGLLKRNEERDSVYDAFRNRVIIPIRERQGRVIGFGGRVLDDTLPKYLNTSETLLFHKSHVVYGLDFAYQAIRSANQVVIVEGYMDVIAAHQLGFNNVVACMGTALTAEQLRQLQRYTNRFVLALDADSAGQAATIRGLNQARQALGKVQKPTLTPDGVTITERLGASLSILSMPEGLDPDDVIRQQPAQWSQLVQSAQPLVDFYFDIVRKQVDLSSALGKGQAVAELAPLIAELGDDIERQHYVQRLSRLVQMDEVLIAGRVQAAMRTLRAAVEPQRRRTGDDEQRSVQGTPQALASAKPSGEKSAGKSVGQKLASASSASSAQEDHLLANLLRDPEIFYWLANIAEQLEIKPLQPTDLERVDNQEILRSMGRYLSGDEPWDVELFQEALPNELHGRLAQLLAYGANYPAISGQLLREDTVKALLRLRLQRLKAENANVKYLLDEAQQSQDMEAVRNFTQTNNYISRELYHLQRLNVNLGQLLASSKSRQRALSIRK
jgi:DNA primase